MIVAAFIVKFIDKVPVIFSQPRLGFHGHPFVMYKLKTLVITENSDTITDSYVEQKTILPSTLTKTGLFWRLSSLDEIPQFWHVLKGEMSLVGPRPVVENELTRYYKEYADYYKLVRPGITGLWQISGRNDVDYDVRVRLDS
jgi:lipopolysaccharide/colanic/teichoic acid biosynthesis glycosyltransferase